MASNPDRGKEIAMLQVTDAAVTVLKSAVLVEGEPSQQGEPATAIRISSAAANDGRERFTLEPVTGPEPGDAPTEATDLDVFVAPEVAAPLDSAVLDVQATPEGPQVILRVRSDLG
jgi:hypothetical protein